MGLEDFYSMFNDSAGSMGKAKWDKNWVKKIQDINCHYTVAAIIRNNRMTCDENGNLRYDYPLIAKEVIEKLEELGYVTQRDNTGRVTGFLSPTN